MLLYGATPVWLLKRNVLWASVPRDGSELPCAGYSGLPWSAAVVRSIPPPWLPCIPVWCIPSLCWNGARGSRLLRWGRAGLCLPGCIPGAAKLSSVRHLPDLSVGVRFNNPTVVFLPRKADCLSAGVSRLEGASAHR